MTAESAPRWSRKHSYLTVTAAALAVIATIFGGIALGQTQQQQPQRPQAGFPDLVSGLKAVPGCLGVEATRTASGKNVIFAWFEDKQAVLRWYQSDMHQHAMRMLIGDQKPDLPLQGVPDDIGPILAIASITFADKPQFEGVSMPVSQISIELYKPLTGGIFLGSRFAPSSLKVPGMKDYTPKSSR